MLASLLCIQQRQVSGTPMRSVLDRRFDYNNDELFFDDNQENVVLEIEECKKEARKLVKDRERVQSYISVISNADRVPKEIQSLKDMVVNGSLASKLNNRHCDTDVMLLFTVQCYLFYCKWKQRCDDEEVFLVLSLF